MTELDRRNLPVTLAQAQFLAKLGLDHAPLANRGQASHLINILLRNWKDRTQKPNLQIYNDFIATQPPPRKSRPKSTTPKAQRILLYAQSMGAE